MSRVLPILFNTYMVLAILDGRKTVTRRLIKPQPQGYFEVNEEPLYIYDTDFQQGRIMPPYQPGDTMYVRETWKCWRANRYEATADIMFRAGGDGVQLQFANGSTDSIDRFDYDTFVNKWFSHNGEWKPSLFMPKEAARIWLKVKDVRVERLQEITANGKAKEGLVSPCRMCRNEEDGKCVGGDRLLKDCPIECIGYSFMKLWNSTIKKSDLDRYGWDANPWVWVIEFERCEKPENM